MWWGLWPMRRKSRRIPHWSQSGENSGTAVGARAIAAHIPGCALNVSLYPQPLSLQTAKVFAQFSTKGSTSAQGLRAPVHESLARCAQGWCGVGQPIFSEKTLKIPLTKYVEIRQFVEADQGCHKI